MPHFPPDSQTQSATPRDLIAAGVAARQHGVITYAQLLECGLAAGAINHRVASGRLQRLWRGVYAFGHQELRPEGRALAAVLACGGGAVLSHRSAARQWGLLASSSERIHVTVPTRGGRRARPGIHLHCVRRLGAEDVAEADSIPVTTTARTLVDLCTTEPERVVEQALEQAYVLRLLPPGAVEAAIERAQGRRTRALRRMITVERRTSSLTRSELEERFLSLVRRAALPEPEVNAWLHGYEVDFLWRKERRIVEMDGYAFHSAPGAFERDRRKDVDLELAGYRVTRFTYNQIVLEPAAAIERTKRLLGSQ